MKNSVISSVMCLNTLILNVRCLQGRHCLSPSGSPGRKTNCSSEDRDPQQPRKTGFGSSPSAELSKVKQCPGEISGCGQVLDLLVKC